MKKSYVIASTLALAITLWMFAGRFTAPPVNQTPGDAEATHESISSQMSVEVRVSSASQVTRHIVSQGQVEPNRTVTVRAETTGRIAEVVARKGQRVRAGDVLVRLEMNDRVEQRQKVEALVQEKQRAYESARQLGKKGLQAERLIDESYSGLRAAQAELAEIRVEIDSTVIRAPFDGILDTRSVELGDYVAVNGEVAVIVDNDPLIVSAHIAQQDIGRFALGESADVTFATGQQRQGEVRFIAPRADAATRTFRVEVEIPNPDSELPSGTSAEARIPTGEVTAHFISPALLSLNDTGEVGVKTVSDGDLVKFHPVVIVLAEAQGIWVTGLPEQAHIITVGQGFVRQGEAVSVVVAEDEKESSALAQHLALPLADGGLPAAGVEL